MSDGTEIFYKDWGPPVVFSHGRPPSEDVGFLAPRRETKHSARSHTNSLRSPLGQTHKMMISRSKCRPLNSRSEQVAFLTIIRTYPTVSSKYPVAKLCTSVRQ